MRSEAEAAAGQVVAHKEAIIQPIKNSSGFNLDLSRSVPKGARHSGVQVDQFRISGTFPTLHCGREVLTA